MARNVRMTHSGHLRDPEVAAEYLSEALEDGDPSVVLIIVIGHLDCSPVRTRSDGGRYTDHSTGLPGLSMPSRRNRQKASRLPKRKWT